MSLQRSEQKGRVGLPSQAVADLQVGQLTNIFYYIHSSGRDSTGTPAEDEFGASIRVRAMESILRGREAGRTARRGLGSQSRRRIR